MHCLIRHRNWYLIIYSIVGGENKLTLANLTDDSDWCEQANVIRRIQPESGLSFFISGLKKYIYIHINVFSQQALYKSCCVAMLRRFLVAILDMFISTSDETVAGCRLGTADVFS